VIVIYQNNFAISIDDIMLLYEVDVAERHNPSLFVYPIIYV